METGVSRSTGILPVSRTPVPAVLWSRIPVASTGETPVGFMGRTPMPRFSYTY